MNKNAAIIEGDITKKFNPVSKVKVSNSDTGESTWIPEESKETHSLSVIKNGIYYAASEGYTAYDTVTVNVSSETEVNYEGIIADMPDLADLGLYDLDDLEGLDGLDLDLDELQDLENLILDGDLEEGEIPTSSTKIKGIDPDSGELHEVGLDQDGNLMEQALPDHIHIVVYPRKWHYEDGEIIDFSGIHVYMMGVDNKRFTCDQYPTGEIPFEELIFPENIADAEKKTEEKHIGTYDGLSVEWARSISGMQTEWAVDPLPFYVEALSGNDVRMCARFVGTIDQDPYVKVIVCSKVDYATYHMLMYTTSTSASEWTVRQSMWTVRVGEENIYRFDTFVVRRSKLSEISVDLLPATTPNDDIILAIYSTDQKTIGGGQEIPVQWMRSDGEILEDTFTITIGDGEDPEPEPDPYADACDFIWEGKKYCFNKSLARCEVMFSNGTVWQTWLGGQSPPYTVDQALKLKLIVQVGWSGGGSTSGGF